MIYLWCGLCLLFFISTCGSDNYAVCKGGLKEEVKTQACSPRTADERSMIALEIGELEIAQSILEALIQDNSQGWFRYPRLAAVYAQQGKVDFIEILKVSLDQQEGGASLSSIQIGFSLKSKEDILSTVGKVLPSLSDTSLEVYDGYIAKVQAAIDLLKKIHNRR